MRIRLHCRTLVFATMAVVASHAAFAAGLSGEWVGQITGPLDSPYTPQYNHVMLKGSVVPARRVSSATSSMAPAQPPQDVTWKLTRPEAAPTAPQSYVYEPKYYYGIYSAAEPPALHIFPGDTVSTRTMDQARDAGIPKHGNGGDVNVGSFYVEGTLPGDTLVVHIVKLRTNKPTGRQGSRFNAHAVTTAYALAAQYD